MINRILQAIERRIDREDAQDRALNLQAAIVGKLIAKRKDDARWAENVAMLQAIKDIETIALLAEYGGDIDGLKVCEVRLNELR